MSNSQLTLLHKNEHSGEDQATIQAQTLCLPPDVLEMAGFVFAEVYYFIGVEISQADAARRQLSAMLGRIGFNWLIKLEWDSRYRIPGNAASNKRFRPHGVFLQKTLHLIEKVLTVLAATGGTTRYANSIDWLRDIWLEAYPSLGLASLLAVVYPPTKEEITARNRAKSPKRGEVRRMLAACRKLKSMEPPTLSARARTAFEYLIDTACAIAEKSDVFRKETFKPFASSLYDLVKSMESPAYTGAFIDGDQLFLQQGKGRYKKAIAEMPVA